MARVPDLANLTVVSTRFLVCFAALTLSLWVVSIGYGRRGHRAIAWLSVTVAFVLTVALVADGVNSYYSYLPNVSDVADAVTQQPPPRLPEPPSQTTTPPSSSPSPLPVPVARTHRNPAPAQGKLMTLAIPAGYGFGRTLAWVWLPPQYFQPNQPRMPVMYLFHGSPGMPKDWFHGGRAASVGQELARRNQPVIEVAPQMSHDWLDDPECVNGVHEQVESHLLDEVIPTVDRSLRTIDSRQGRIFAGMSAGGYCALNLGLRNRDLVSTVLDLSGYTVPTHSGGMKALFGAHVIPDATENSPAHYAADLRTGPPMRIWLDSGSDDREVLHEMNSIAPILRTDGMTVMQKVRPGGHTYSVWRPALQQSAAWAMASAVAP